MNMKESVFTCHLIWNIVLIEYGVLPEYAVHGNIGSDENNEVELHTSALWKFLSRT